MEKVIIYTDGACSGNPGPGGWAAILMYKDKQKEISGGMKNRIYFNQVSLFIIRIMNSIREFF